MTEETAGPGAAGAYRYLLNGDVTAVSETWAREDLPAGRQRVTSRRSAPGVEIAVDAVLGEGLVAFCVITWQSGNTSVEADYEWRDNELYCRRTQGDASSVEQRIDRDQEGPLLLFPLMRIFVGPVIARLLDNGGTGDVLVPDIRQPDDPASLLTPRVSQRMASVLDGRTALDIDGVTVPCRLCEYTGEQYGTGSRFWLDGRETLLRYQWQQGPDQHWDVWLQTHSQAQ